MKAKSKAATKAKGVQMDASDPHAEFHRQLGVAFQDQESAICDLLTMSNIADRLVDTGEQVFALSKLREMIQAFRDQWYADVEKAPLKPAA